MKYKHIIFDIDGTLLDTEHAVLCSLQDTMLQLSQKHYDLTDLRVAIGVPGEKTLEHFGISDPIDGNIVWNEHLRKYFDTIQPFPGIEQLLLKLKNEGFRLGIITSKNRMEYAQDFMPFGLDRHFDTAICLEDSESPKPSPYPMLKYLEKSGIKSNEALYIGDTDYDRQCATGAGVHFGLALWGCKFPDHITATYRFNLPQDIISVLCV